MCTIQRHARPVKSRLGSRQQVSAGCFLKTIYLQVLRVRQLKKRLIEALKPGAVRMIIIQTLVQCSRPYASLLVAKYRTYLVLYLASPRQVKGRLERSGILSGFEKPQPIPAA
jgi:hypothetical protein